MKKVLAAGIMCLVFMSPMFAGGRSEGPAADRTDGPVDIVATTGMIGDIVSNVVGERGSVFVLMDDEIDPHLFRPTRSDIARMQRADIIFYNGLNLEGQMADTLVQLARGRPVYAVTELFDETTLLEDEEDEDYFDPHLWMDVSLWMRAVENVVAAMSEHDPPGADDYRSNADLYLRELAELDEYAREVIASIPSERRYLVTAHDAFQYLGRAYGLEVIGVQGISTESEAGLEDINSLVNFIVQNRITAVFAETTVADRALMAVIEGAAAQGHEVVIGGELFSDAMGPAGSWEGTYIGMIDHNVTTIARTLGGSPPPRGFRGRLSP
ncbi:MAG: manganese transporter [Spirochaetaceae bacterium]|nr:MAG: manganese transporter [Spirochaetaceae bacterium]